MNAADLVAARAAAQHHELQRPVVIGIAGAVAAGKSTFAAEVDDALLARGLRADIVSTDGFLFPNASLVERGLAARKGFPETYDVAAVRSTLTEVRAGAGTGGERVPVYSHQLYDVEPGPGRMLPPLEVLVLEGINAIGAAADLLDLAVYLDAAADDLERWYVTRFHELVEEARHDPASFYASMTGLGGDEVEALARSTWRGINLVNLRDHIAPTRALADLVVVKGPDHRVVEVRDDA
ncbi:MAG: hypothetical protein WEC34_07035 [Acidimicrobiia bacterium]